MLKMIDKAKKFIGILVLVPFLSLSANCVESADQVTPLANIAEEPVIVEDNVCEECELVELTEEEQVQFAEDVATVNAETEAAFLAPIVWICRIAAAAWKAWRAARKARLAWKALTTAQKCRRAAIVATEIAAVLVTVNAAIQSLLEKKRDCGLTPDEQKLLDELIKEREELKKVQEEAERLKNGGQCPADDSGELETETTPDSPSQP